MANVPTRIVAIDQIAEGAVIAFEDNRTAIFPASFLYSLLPQVQELFDSDVDLDDGPDEL